MNSQTDKYFITGTDTGVGKTVLSLLLMQFFYAKGDVPFYIKPFQTGCAAPFDTDSDANFIYQNIPALKGADPSDSMIYCFKTPKAPFFAARDEGFAAAIDAKMVQKFVEKKAQAFNPVVLEGAGGVLVPVSNNYLILDFIEITSAKPIIAARAGLGTINHTLLTIEALRARELEPAGVIFIDPEEIEIDQDMIDENIEAVQNISGVRVAGVINRIEDFSNPERRCFDVLEKIF